MVRVSAFVDGVPNAVPFVDTNVRRVLHRLFFGVDVLEPAGSEGELRDLAEALVPRGHGWKWSQSVMEFGAVQCTARKPLCESCPLSDLCAARPMIWGTLATLSRPERATYRYEDSNRYYRGRVLAALREAPEEGIALRELGEGLREGFGEENLPWLCGVVESLEKDGLAVIEGQRPARPGFVVEERPAYDAGTGEQGKSTDADRGAAEARVRLP